MSPWRILKNSVYTQWPDHSWRNIYPSPWSPSPTPWFQSEHPSRSFFPCARYAWEDYWPTWWNSERRFSLPASVPSCRRIWLLLDRVPWLRSSSWSRPRWCGRGRRCWSWRGGTIRCSRWRWWWSGFSIGGSGLGRAFYLQFLWARGFLRQACSAGLWGFTCCAGLRCWPIRRATPSSALLNNIRPIWWGGGRRCLWAIIESNRTLAAII